VAGAAAIYFLTTERGRQWLRELPDAGRRCASSVREAMALLREISEQVEHSVGAFEQALSRVGDTIAAREHATTGAARNGGEHSLTG
jgi:hypothetical protein